MSNHPPLIVARAIAIRNKFGYGDKLRSYAESLSEAEQRILRQYFEPDPEAVESFKEAFREWVKRGTSDMAYTVREMGGRDYLIEGEGQALALVSFSPEINRALSEEQKIRLVTEFKDILIKRLNLEDKKNTALPV